MLDKKQNRRQAWATRLGFYLAAIGSACGLGNLWRFPYVVGENGGGAFFLLYVLLVMTIGLPLLIGELMLGKYTGKSVLTALSSLNFKNKKNFRMIGRLSIVLSLLVLSYYTVISGWVLYFAIQFFSGSIGFHTGNEIGTLSVLLKNGFLQSGLASVHLIFCSIVVLKGVQEGLEKFIGWMMPVFGILLVILVFRSVSLSTSTDAFRFLLYPDFSKLTLSSLGQAIGHVLFTLSIGFGTMVTFGSYMIEGEHIPTAGLRVAMIDTVISLVAGLLIFPIAFQATNIPMTDPGLLFEALPQFLLQMQGGLLFGFAFFVCLYLAALGASIGLMEVIVSNFVDRSRTTRKKSTYLTALVAFMLGLIPALSGSILREVKLHQRGILETLDAFVINWALPIIALGMAVAISFGIPKRDQETLFIHPDRVESSALYSHWMDILKWIVPIVIILGLLLQILSLFKS